MIIAQGKRGTSAALGYRGIITMRLFAGLPRRRGKPAKRGQEGGWAAITQGGGLGSLALGYYRAAPTGAPVPSFPRDLAIPKLLWSNVLAIVPPGVVVGSPLNPAVMNLEEICLKRILRHAR
jgi:hypothetical protein